MTDLEERVRDALNAQAERFATSPDAWQRTTARAGRRTQKRRAHHPARQRWLNRFTPLAAAAAVIVIGVGTAIVAATGGFHAAPRHASPVSSASPPLKTTPKATPKATPKPTPSASVGDPLRQEVVCDVPGLPTTARVVGVRISAKVTKDGTSTWWTRLPKGFNHNAGTSLGLCHSQSNGGGGGVEAPLSRGQLLRVDSFDIGLSVNSAGGGIAAASVTSVEADLANGKVVHGTVVYGAGFPYAAWWIGYPPGISATLVFRDAAGNAVKEVAEPFPAASALEHPAPLPPNYLNIPAECTGLQSDKVPAQQVRAQQVMNGIKVWTYVRFVYWVNAAVPTFCELTGITGATANYVGAYTLPAGQSARTVFVLYPTSSLSGVAAPGVTSVTAVLADGRKYTGTLVHGKGFSYPVWLVSYPLKDPATLVFRNAAGAEVAVLHEPANP
ncbi:MAG TPA: hypothetical protein VN714_28880 [Trebonia sp.]|nr:hypothetical protein [Trebonia sp.]